MSEAEERYKFHVKLRTNSSLPFAQWTGKRLVKTPYRDEFGETKNAPRLRFTYRIVASGHEWYVNANNQWNAAALWRLEGGWLKDGRAVYHGLTEPEAITIAG